MGAGQCTVCHDATNVTTPYPNAEFYKLVHGIHNSELMPAGKWDFDATALRSQSATRPT